MTWYYATAIIVAILVGSTGIISTLLKGVWKLADILAELKTSIVELRLTLATQTFKIDETRRDLTSIEGKVENVQITQQSLQVRTIRLEEKLDKITQ